MISIIITSYKEPKTIGKAISSIIDNKLSEKHQIIVGAPDDETLDVAKKMINKNKNIQVIKDKGKGKPAALNLLVSKARGDILVLTDGDVFVSSNAINELIKVFKDEKVGAVSGRPVSVNPRDNKYGYWSYLLTEIAHDRRQMALSKGYRLFCSGYLFAIRKNLFPKLPENLLSEDGYISHKVYTQGYKISYSPRSIVYVKYPDNYNDWIIQKKRSAGGYNQIKKMMNVEIRSFKSESIGAFGLIKYVKDPKELYWLLTLFFSRLILWSLIYKDINIKNKNHKEIWQRVESTK